MISIRKSTYRGRAGFLICGTDPLGRRISIFTRTRESAERIKVKVIKGQEVTVEDFQSLLFRSLKEVSK